MSAQGPAKVRRLFWGLLLALALSVPASAQGTRLLRRPAVSKDLVAFSYGGDLWVVSRSGGEARRLTATPVVETDPRFSPDGSRVAFTAIAAGNADVYVMPTAGGNPTRLTYHPEADLVRGFTPDGRRVIFASSRACAPSTQFSSYLRLRKLGPLVGTRTWGGTVGTTLYPLLIDGGGITAPSLAFYDLDGKWAVENEGVAPDIEVELTPAEVIRGRDPQLERAVEEALKLLERNPVRRLPRPASIDRTSKRKD